MYICVSTLSHTNISETRGPIATKFYMKHHWVGGKDALGFGPGQHSSAFIFDRIFFILAGNENIFNISDEFEIRPDRTKDCGVSCP